MANKKRRQVATDTNWCLKSRLGAVPSLVYMLISLAESVFLFCNSNFFTISTRFFSVGPWWQNGYHPGHLIWPKIATSLKKRLSSFKTMSSSNTKSRRLLNRRSRRRSGLQLRGDSVAIEQQGDVLEPENRAEPEKDKVQQSLELVFQKRGKARKRVSSTVVQTKDYESESRRPIVCLAFVLPLLAFYEVGSIFFGGESIRSGIDQWIHVGLSQLGMGELVVLPLITIGVLIALHHRNQDNWRMRPTVLLGMALEAIGLGLILFWAAKAISLTSGGGAEVVTAGMENSWQLAVAFIGSGIYEELLFRLVLLLPVMVWARTLIKHQKISTVVAVIAVSLFFAALHYNVLNPAGNEFELSSFGFRFGASVIFCVLFLFRGFGIAVGTHVAYDLLTQV